MSSILAIAGLTLRAAVRSKVFAVLAALVIGGIVGLPLVMKSDGSMAGQVRLFLDYTLGLTVLLLSVMAVWTGAGAVSLEVANRQIQLVVVKPVRTLEIWIGKWLGLMAINLVLLAAAGALIYGMLRWTTRPEVLTADERVKLREEILVARQAILPQALGRGGNLAVAPGQAGCWRFELPAKLKPAKHVFLQFRFVTSRPDLRNPMAVLWLVGGAGQSVQRQYSIQGVANQDYSFRISVPEDSRRLEVACLNVGEQAPVTLLFPAADSVKLQVNAGVFEANYLRALLMILARLAFFSALGLTAGAVFSFPVAVFVSLALLLLAMVGHWLAGGVVRSADETVGRWATISERVLPAVYQALSAVLPPLHRFNPLDFLTDGRLIPWQLTGQTWLVLAGGYAVILGLLGAGWFSRRELGLPAE